MRLPKEVDDAFLQRADTICGFIIFPVSWGSLNQRRGTHPRIQDRWDLTLEVIRRFYEDGTSPMAKTMDRYAGFLALFGTFDGYIDHFHSTSSMPTVQCASCSPSTTSSRRRFRPNYQTTSSTAWTAWNY